MLLSISVKCNSVLAFYFSLTTSLFLNLVLVIKVSLKSSKYTYIHTYIHTYIQSGKESSTVEDLSVQTCNYCAQTVQQHILWGRIHPNELSIKWQWQIWKIIIWCWNILLNRFHELNNMICKQWLSPSKIKCKDLFLDGIIQHFYYIIMTY